jgi:methyl-accepting chemotaxis protein
VRLGQVLGVGGGQEHGVLAQLALQVLVPDAELVDAEQDEHAGRGFAVVASEVKTLAEQTGRATDKIRSQIASTQSATREAVDAIGVIQGTIRTLNEVSSTIAAAVEEQSAVTREMSGSMQTASHGVSTIASGMDTIAEASVRVDRATRQVREASRAIG